MKIPVENTTNMPIYVGAYMVLPGETRHFEEQDVPHHLRPAPVEEEAKGPADPLAELLTSNVPVVVAALAEMSAADIERLGDLEQKGQGRKGILSAIAEIQLKAGAEAELLAKVAALSDEEIAAQIEAASTGSETDPEYLAALESEAAKRNPGAAE